MARSEQARAGVAASLRRSPVIAVVRTTSTAEAESQAQAFLAGGIELVEITFTVPRGSELVRALLTGRSGDGPPWIGMGTVTGAARAEEALAAGAEFLVSPNVSSEVARKGQAAGAFVVLGALTPTEIVAARDAGADLVKVYPLPPVGGPAYLATVRQPLGDVPMLAAGGFGIEEIPAYRAAGAQAFGIGGPLLGADEAETRRRIGRALELAREQEAR